MLLPASYPSDHDSLKRFKRVNDFEESLESRRLDDVRTRAQAITLRYVRDLLRARQYNHRDVAEGVIILQLREHGQAILLRQTLIQQKIHSE